MSEHGHHHHHEPLSGARLVITIALNLLITVVEVIGGLLSGSLALITDAAHNFSDMLSLVISYVAIRISGRPRSLDYTFGWKRAQIMAAVINASVLVVVGLLMIIKGVERFGQPSEIAGGLMVTVASIGLAANVIGTLLLRKGAGDNLNIRSSYLHLLSDAVSSAAVIVGGLAIMFLHITWIDPVLTIVISLYIVRESVLIIAEAAGILMMKTPDGVDAQAIETELEAVPGVVNLHHVHMWQVDEHDRHFEGHVVLAEMPLGEATEILATLEGLLAADFAFHHCVLQIETERGHDGRMVSAVN